jgi:hypothetical protein
LGRRGRGRRRRRRRRRRLSGVGLKDGLDGVCEMVWTDVWVGWLRGTGMGKSRSVKNYRQDCGFDSCARTPKSKSV